jgi:hypothetical protein
MGWSSLRRSRNTAKPPCKNFGICLGQSGAPQALPIVRMDRLGLVTRAPAEDEPLFTPRACSAEFVHDLWRRVLVGERGPAVSMSRPGSGNC